MPTESKNISVTVHPKKKIANVEPKIVEIEAKGTHINWTFARRNEALTFKYLFLDGRQYSLNDPESARGAFVKVKVRQNSITLEDKKNEGRQTDYIYTVVVQDTDTGDIYITSVSDGPRTDGHPVIRNR